MEHRRAPSALRSTAVLALAALCLHQVVYLVSFGAGAGPALEGTGHGYLSLAAPLLALVAICAIAGTLLSAVRRSRVPLPGRRGAGWALSTVLLLAIFGAQEAVEVLLRTGSLGDLLSLAHHTSAAALVAATALGRLVAVALSGLRALEARLTRTAGSRRRRAPRRPRPGHVALSPASTAPEPRVRLRPPPTARLGCVDGPSRAPTGATAS